MRMAKLNNSARNPAGLHGMRNGAVGSIAKPRIIHTYSPKVYKIKPEEFLELVQKLTGRTDTATSQVDSTASTAGFVSQSLDNADISSSSQLHSEEHDADSALAGTPMSTQLLASLPSPRFVTLNFLPMLAATPSDFNQSRRNTGFSFPSAAY